MSKTLPDFVSDDATSTPAEIPDPAPVLDAAPAAETTPDPAPAGDGRQRGPDGKFLSSVAPEAPAAPVAPAPAPAADLAPPPPVAAPAPSPPTEHGFVPLAVVLDEREKRQAAEKRASELEAWRDQQKAAANRQPPPDFNADPQAALSFQEQRFQEALASQRVDMSRRWAVQQHGQELVDKAHQWGFERCARDPLFNQTIAQSADPIEAAIYHYQLAHTDPAELAAYRAWKATQTTAAPAAALAPAAPQPVAVPTAPPAPAAPRPSLAAAPSAATTGALLPRDAAETYRVQFGP